MSVSLVGGAGINRGIEQSEGCRHLPDQLLLSLYPLLRSIRTWLGGFFLNVTCERPG